MYVDFSGLFHRSSKDRSGKGRVKIPLDKSAWPKEWSEIVYKDYPRLEKIELSQTSPKADIFSTIEKRVSGRTFTQRPISREDISTLLRYACGIMEDREGQYHRAQPSGGGRYPIEVYPLLFVNSDIPTGVYHYAVETNALNVLWSRAFTAEDISALFTYPWAQRASFAIVLSAVFSRNQMKYGERGYRQVLIETGAIVQNIYLVATALGMKCCAIDGVYEVPIEKLIDIDGISESVVCTLVLG
jgi:SagB-type dehydrogenase family enzyme